jgi:LysM repeat protein
MGAFEAPTVPTATPTATLTPSSTATTAPGVTPSATSTPSATLSPTPVTPTATPTPTATSAPGGSGPPAPQPTPAGVQPAGSAGGTFRCGDWRVTIPSGVVPDGGGIHCGDFDPNVAPGAPAGYRLLRHVINVNVYDNNGSWITSFAKPLAFCYPYADVDLSAAGGDASSFVVQTAAIGGAWSTLATTADAGARQACAQVSHLTLFELSARLDSQPTMTYVVQPGDTLFWLAQRFRTTVAALRSLNALASDRIFVGQVLRVPGQASATPAPTVAGGGSQTAYIVQPGDTLFRLSLRFRTTVAALQAANGLGGSIRIYAGQRLLVPGSGPAPAPRPTVTVAPGVVTHVVRSGENLFRIGLRYRTTVAALQAANGLGSSILIYVGQTLVIPGSSTTPAPAATPRPAGVYVVQAGDTLFRIALRFGTTVVALQRANGLAGTLIYAGQRLVIP